MAGRENSSACKQTTPAAYILTSRKRLGPGFSFAHDPHEIGASLPLQRHFCCRASAPRALTLTMTAAVVFTASRVRRFPVRSRFHKSAPPEWPLLKKAFIEMPSSRRRPSLIVVCLARHFPARDMGSFVSSLAPFSSPRLPRVAIVAIMAGQLLPPLPTIRKARVGRGSLPFSPLSLGGH